MDEASFAAVPQLVHIGRRRGGFDWNTYAIVATIELARAKNGNPDVPDWLHDDYFEGLKQLAESGLRQIKETEDKEEVGLVLAIIALWKGCKICAIGVRRKRAGGNYR